MDQKTSRIVESAIEIADGNLSKIQDHFEGVMGRGKIVEYYIVPWAEESEQLWEELHLENNDLDYYEFIDEFAKRKMDGLLCRETCGIEMR